MKANFSLLLILSGFIFSGHLLLAQTEQVDKENQADMNEVKNFIENLGIIQPEEINDFNNIRNEKINGKLGNRYANEFTKIMSMEKTSDIDKGMTIIAVLDNEETTSLGKRAKSYTNEKWKVLLKFKVKHSVKDIKNWPKTLEEILKEHEKVNKEYEASVKRNKQVNKEYEASKERKKRAEMLLKVLWWGPENKDKKKAKQQDTNKKP